MWAQIYKEGGRGGREGGEGGREGGREGGSLSSHFNIQVNHSLGVQVLRYVYM